MSRTVIEKAKVAGERLPQRRVSKSNTLNPKTQSKQHSQLDQSKELQAELDGDNG